MARAARRGASDLTALETRAIDFVMGEAQGDQGLAYRMASPNSKATEKTNKENASRLFNRPHVKAEMARRMAMAAEKASEIIGIGKADVMRQLQEDRVLARALAQPMAAIKANELLGKELGMFVERSESGRPGDFERMSTDELRDYVAGGAAGRGASAARRVDPSGPRGSGKPVGKPH